MSLFGFKNPIVAILRGITPDESIDICQAIIDQGVEIIEVPLNSPTPFKTIEKLVNHFDDKVLLGAGTVLESRQVQSLVEIGAKLIVTPNYDQDVVKASLDNEMLVAPGVYTPSEIFAAYKAGVRCVKLFPGGRLGIPYFKDVQAVLPEDLDVVIVGGVNSSNIRDWISAGVSGVGVGSAIYKPGDSTQVVADKARALIKSLSK